MSELLARWVAADRQVLWADLARAEGLVRDGVARWRRLMAQSKVPEHWGMIHVTEAEVDAYLNHEFRDPLDRDRGVLGRFDPPERLVGNGQRRHRLAELASAFALGPADIDLLLLCLLPEVDSRYRRIYGYLQNDATRQLPTIELLNDLLASRFGDVAVAQLRLAADRPLVSGRLVELVGRNAPALDEVRIDPRIIRFLLDDDSPDDRLVGIVTERAPSTIADLVLAAGRADQLRDLARWCARHSAGGGVVLLHGPAGSGRLSTAAALAGEAGIPLVVVDAGAAARSSLGLESVLALADREARLRRSAVALIDVGGEQLDVVLSVSIASGSLAFVIAEAARDPGGRGGFGPFVRLAVDPPGFALRCQLWERYLPGAAEFVDAGMDRVALATTLAASFQLTPGRMVDAVATARSIAASRDPVAGRIRVDDVVEGCRRRSGRGLVALAKKIEPSPDADFDRLVLADASRRQLDELRARVRLRGQLVEMGFDARLQADSLLVLFTGSSGTGKTMAAKLLADEQGVDLYSIDLAEVVSKYIGETEKNLRQVFDEAEGANAVLFFDEADALFGKRGEVKESRDRWANIEVNFLLQRVEDYAGVVVLATNLRQNIDEAFLRRIHAIVEFPFPDADARLAILAGMLPPVERMARPDGDRLRELAERFQLAGGSIRNVVIDAAFRAVDGGCPPEITMRHLAVAIAREYQKLGKPVTRGEFGAELYEWVEREVLLIDRPTSGSDR